MSRPVFRNFDYPEPAQGRMARQQLARIVMDATALHRAPHDNDRLPAWTLLKVSTAEDRLHMAADYLRYKASPGINAYGYPGVVGQRLPDAGTVTKTRIDGNPYLCVAYEVERRTVQPLRAAAALVGGPLVMYAATKLPSGGALRAATFLTGAAVTVWSAWVWHKANAAMVE